MAHGGQHQRHKSQQKAQPRCDKPNIDAILSAKSPESESPNGRASMAAELFKGKHAPQIIFAHPYLKDGNLNPIKKGLAIPMKKAKITKNRKLEGSAAL